MLSYFAVFEPDAEAGGFVVRFPDFDMARHRGIPSRKQAGWGPID